MVQQNQVMTRQNNSLQSQDKVQQAPAKPKLSKSLEINKSLSLRNDQYYPGVEGKEAIFLHHTSGLTARGAFDWWNQTPEHVGVPYIIDRDGTIYEVFPPNRWSFHLGIKGDDDYMEKRSIGIEIVSAGGLQAVEKKNIFYPHWPLTIQPKEISKDEVEILDKAWREFKIFQIYTEEQINSLSLLIPFLIEQFNMPIPKVNKDFYEYNDKIIRDHIPGIWSHSSVRKDKSDIFPYEPLLDMLMGLKF